MRKAFSLGIALVVVLAGHSAACVLCTRQGPPLAWEIGQARLVVFGPIVSARLNANGLGGTSELKIEAVLKDDKLLRGQKTLSIARYVPPNPKIKYLAFVDVVNGQFDVYRSLVFDTDAVLKYLKDAPSVAPGQSAVARLRYFFDYLNHQEAEIAGDAYKEWAVATDKDVSLVAPTLPVNELRSWLSDRKTPPERLNLYAYLLGACGTAQDAELLRRLAINPDERMANALDGILAGLIHLQPDEGWKLAREILADRQRPFTQRHAALRLLQFQYSAHGDKVRPQVLDCAKVVLTESTLLDLMVEHLRQWKMWDLTETILASYRQPSIAPVTRRAIVRYALSCPQPAARAFVEEVKQQNKDLVDEVVESLQFETPIK